MHNCTPLVISGDGKNKQLTLLSQRKLAITVGMQVKIVTMTPSSKPLFRRRTNHTFHQKPNPSRETVPYTAKFSRLSITAV